MDFDKYDHRKTAMPRELGVWKVATESITLISKTKLPDSNYLGFPTIDRVPPFSPSVELEYPCTVGCALVEGNLTCQEGDPGGK